jgi:hypothetical protein
MKNIKEEILNNFVGNWFNEDLNQEIGISEITKGWKYLFAYNPNIRKGDNEINEEKTELMFGLPNDNVVHFSNSFGYWNLNFLSKNRFELLNENPVTNEVIHLVFDRKIKMEE